MEQSPTNNENTERLLAEQKNRLEALEQAFTALEQRAKKYEAEWSSLYDQNRDLREENHRLQQAYETLRIQKGGFGFKMLLLSGLGGFITALVLSFIYLKLKPKEPAVAAFRQFQQENTINFELAIGNGQFEEVEQTLENSLARPEYKAIEPQIIFIKEMMKATKNRCQ
ncbi:MAG TPA: hypothetical protein PK228_07880 [Saprospiraceae bacterium]|nr:hypothetical protein [Saprospiraceae bacterium]